VELSEQMGEWILDSDECLCEESVEHRDMADVPVAVRKVSEALQGALGEACLPAGESDCTGKIIVISKSGDDIQEACLRALAIKKNAEDDEDIQIWDEASVTEQDWSGRKSFCADDDDDGDDDDAGEDEKKIQAATRVLARSLVDHFQFGFSETLVTAPVIWGGKVGDCIVGVLGMRVWT